MYYREADASEERRGCLGKIIFLLIMLLLTGAVVVGGIFLTHEIFDTVEGGDILIIDIPEGSTTEDIADILICYILLYRKSQRAVSSFTAETDRQQYV